MPNEGTDTRMVGDSTRPKDDSGVNAHSESAAPAQANSASRLVGSGRRAHIHSWRQTLFVAGMCVVALAAALYFGVPWTLQTLNTVSTDDAYVNGHVTLVAARVPGHVVQVLVDDNNRVHEGDLLVQLDKKPYRVLVEERQAAVATATADLLVAEAQARGIEAQARSQRWKLQHAIEDVENQVALLRANVSALAAQQATLDRAQADFTRAEALVNSKAISREDFDQRREAFLVAGADVKKAIENVYRIRVGLGLPEEPKNSKDLAQVPSDLDQNVSTVRQAQAELIQSAAQLGVVHSFAQTPKKMLEEFQKSAPGGDIDRLFAEMVKQTPAVKQAEAKLLEAQRGLEEADLNLSYCDVFAEIDGVVTSRDVNRGNNVQAGQQLMGVRSLKEIWVDANFKETQVADLRIGQRVDLHVDMYGKRHVFKGLVSGFSMGTGSTMALLPPENATGNFVKVVQRLPVRIDLVNYDAEKVPLFFGVSVIPYVHFKQPPTGPNAGKILQPYVTESTASASTRSTETR